MIDINRLLDKTKVISTTDKASLVPTNAIVIVVGTCLGASAKARLYTDGLDIYSMIQPVDFELSMSKLFPAFTTAEA